VTDANGFIVASTGLLAGNHNDADLPQKLYPSKMRVERPKKEQNSHEAKKARTNRAVLAQSR